MGASALWNIFSTVDSFVSSDAVESRNSVRLEVALCVETYVRRSMLFFPVIFKRTEQGGQVKDDCGGRAYEVMSFEDRV